MLTQLFTQNARVSEFQSFSWSANKTFMPLNKNKEEIVTNFNSTRFKISDCSFNQMPSNELSLSKLYKYSHNQAPTKACCKWMKLLNTRMPNQAYDRRDSQSRNGMECANTVGAFISIVNCASGAWAGTGTVAGPGAGISSVWVADDENQRQAVKVSWQRTHLSQNWNCAPKWKKLNSRWQSSWKKNAKCYKSPKHQWQTF